MHICVKCQHCKVDYDNNLRVLHYCKARPVQYEAAIDPVTGNKVFKKPESYTAYSPIRTPRCQEINLTGRCDFYKEAKKS